MRNATPEGIAWELTELKCMRRRYKMKVSIVFGVAQMTLGLCCSLVNHIYYKDRRSIWFGFVPEVCFFLSIFGYLVFMIFAKWATDWVGEAKRPPSLLNTLIAMFMSPGSYKEEDRIFAGQEHVQLLLLLIAFISVPLLLLPKPILAYLDMKKKAAQPLPRSELDAVAEGSPAAGPSGEAEGEEQEGDGLADVVVHQVIHTIEFVLGSISNTALVTPCAPRPADYCPTGATILGRRRTCGCGHFRSPTRSCRSSFGTRSWLHRLLAASCPRRSTRPSSFLPLPSGSSSTLACSW